MIMIKDGYKFIVDTLSDGHTDGNYFIWELYKQEGSKWKLMRNGYSKTHMEGENAVHCAHMDVKFGRCRMIHTRLRTERKDNWEYTRRDRTVVNKYREVL